MPGQNKMDLDDPHLSPGSDERDLLLNPRERGVLSHLSPGDRDFFLNLSPAERDLLGRYIPYIHYVSPEARDLLRKYIRYLVQPRMLNTMDLDDRDLLLSLRERDVLRYLSPGERDFFLNLRPAERDLLGWYIPYIHYFSPEERALLRKYIRYVVQPRMLNKMDLDDPRLSPGSDERDLLLNPRERGVLSHLSPGERDFFLNLSPAERDLLSKYIPYIGYVSPAERDLLRKYIRYLVQPRMLEKEKEKIGWLLLSTSLILEVISAILEQLEYPLLCMVMAFLGLMLCVVEFIYKAKMEGVTFKWNGVTFKWKGVPLPWIYSKHPPHELFGTTIEYFVLLAGLWQLFLSVFGYIYARKALQNPIKMGIIMLLFVMCELVGRLVKKCTRAITRRELEP